MGLSGLLETLSPAKREREARASRSSSDRKRRRSGSDRKRRRSGSRSGSGGHRRRRSSS